MCGIFGYVGNEDAVAHIVEGLKKLEYRGYDSAGAAVCRDGEILVTKRRGRLAELEAALAESPIAGRTGIGHTRWATHGEPTDGNAHPHVSGGGKIAVVHNGIIENYGRLKERLAGRGVVFQSETDSEVAAQLTEYYYNGACAGDLLKAVARATERLEGSYALGVLCADMPGTIVAARKDSPLVIGLTDGAAVLASDVPAVLKYTNAVYYMEDGEIAVVRAGAVEFYNAELEPIEKAAETVPWSAESAEKGGHAHFMYKEMLEQPKVLKDTVESVYMDGKNKETLANVTADADKVMLVACGSAYNAGVVGRYVFERLCGVSVEADLASEFRYRDMPLDHRTLCVFISQSGETADTIAALREAKRKGARTLAIVNVLGSTVAREAEQTLYTLAGPEIAVATTKAFTAQLALLYALAVDFAEKRGKLRAAETKALVGQIRALPAQAARVFDWTETIQQAAARYFNCKNAFYIGRGVDYAIALEGSLKLKEISYVHSEAYAGGELKHGPISLIEDGTLVVAICCCERLAAKTAGNVRQVMSRGAKVLGVEMEGQSDEARKTREDIKGTWLTLPHTDELFAPMLCAVALQLFAYYVASNKGLDIDKPRNLAKSVTVE